MTHVNHLHVTPIPTDLDDLKAWERIGVVDKSASPDIYVFDPDRMQAIRELLEKARHS